MEINRDSAEQREREAVTEDLDRALAALEAGRARVYYDADADADAREEYYAGVDSDARPRELFRALAVLLEATHRSRPAYKPSELVYPWVDLHPDRRLRSIYSGRSFEPEELVRADADIARERIARMQLLVAVEPAMGPREFEAEFDRLEAELPFNCEHVVPQSWFAKREPMRGDLHHLFTCESRCNSFRGNTPFAEFDDRRVFMDDCGRSEDGGFEPSAGKGPAARATLYFLLRYPGQIGDEARELQHDRLQVLLDWHRADPAGEHERHRNVAIAELQGNRNPLVDHPDWADRIAFDTGFVAPRAERRFRRREPSPRATADSPPA